ncbi:MAG: endo-1,4-beta-xylanase [Chitinivibrionales bacterium]
MNKTGVYKKIVTVGVFLLVVSVAGMGQGRGISSNILGDGSFEKGMSPFGHWEENPSLGTVSVSEKSAHGGKSSVRMEVLRKAKDNWLVQLQRKGFNIRKNEVYELTFWVRREKAPAPIEVVFVKGSPPWSYYSGKTFTADTAWTKCTMNFTAPYTTTDIQLAFQGAHHPGVYYIDDISMKKAGEFDLKDVSSDWYEKAEQRIDSLRKGDLSITIIDKNGKPYAGKLTYEHESHEFEWGSCLNLHGNKDDKQYKKTFEKHFNAGVFENALKWEEFERVEGKPKHEDVEQYLRWSEEKGFPIRGHALVWGIEKYNYDQHWARLKDDAFLVNAIRDRITRDVSYYKGRIPEYDVWNEPVHETALFNRLGDDILDSAFVWARRADPDAKLYINEYSIISGMDAKAYRDLIQRLLDNGVPVDGIGVQGHFSGPVEPLEVASKLNYMAELGLPIKITEFDIDVAQAGMGEQEMAQEYAEMFRTAFSHPAVEGLLIWGFWEERIWKRQCGWYDSDWNAKPVADTIYNLIHNHWSTDGEAKVEDGKHAFRGFYGTYRIHVKGKKEPVEVVLSSKNPSATVDLTK